MITETEKINGVASVFLADELETVEYVATVETDVEFGAGGGRYVNDTRVTFDEITLHGVEAIEDVVSWEVEDQLRREVAQILDRYVGPPS